MPASLPAVLLLASQPSRAGHLADARAAERNGDPAAEHAACVALVEETPGGPGAEACRRRLVWLDARQDGAGGFGALEALQTVRRGRRDLELSDARARVEAIATHPDASTRVRDEARLWLGRDALEQQADPEAALRWTRPLWDRLAPEAGRPGGLRAQVADVHARALLASGDPDSAGKVEAVATPIRSAVPREGLPLAIRSQRREHVRLAAWAGLGLFGIAAGPPAARTWTRAPRPRPLGLAPLLVVGLGAVGLVAAWDAAVAPAVLAVLATLTASHLVSAGALAATPPGARRTGLRVLAGLGTLAAAWLASDALGLAAAVGL